MVHILKAAFTSCAVFLSMIIFSQETVPFRLQVVDEQQNPLPQSTLELYTRDSSLLKVQLADSTGWSAFSLTPSSYLVRVTRTGFLPQWQTVDPSGSRSLVIIMRVQKGDLQGVTVAALRPFVELQPGKTVVNIDASITSVGSTLMEALEKMPGITIDKDGNISLKGKSGVSVMIDGKPTYLDPSQLATLLSGMSASQVNQVEIMENPPARYDAAGNAGVINIKTKKIKQKGFNGSLNSSYGQGRYHKNNDGLQLNFRSGRWNLFANYNFNNNAGFTRIYALRRYFEDDGITIASQLEQPSFIKGSGISHSLRAGIDYSLSEKTNMALGFSGLKLSRDGNGNNPAQWMDAHGNVDSVILTKSNTKTAWQNAGMNLNFRHVFSASRELSADFDMIGYRIRSDQFFENFGISPTTYTEGSRAVIPNDINILSAKADYTEQIKNVKMEGGWKSSRITTDNLAAYEHLDGNTWKPDLGRSNHFLYEEYIHAFYASAETKLKKLTLQGGLRYEMTNYDANQLGNAVVKDSSFSRKYNSFFPSLFANWNVDSSHVLSFSAGRRIDRPAFQKLNPFMFIINKYTYQVGNPFYRPQYTWNFELTHMYRNKLITGISYSTTDDYFSQVFPLDSNGIVLYTEGNLGRLQNLGISAGVQLTPASWWSVSTQAVLNHKKMEGFIDKAYSANITQLNFNFNNQFRFKKGWGAELSGFYTSKSQHDIQEVVDPSGQLSIGLSKTVLQGKGTLRLAARDIFYTQWMKGNTYFTRAHEYFKLTRDTRVLTVSLVYRFGKSFKTIRRSQGAAGDEIQRVGNG